MTTNKVGTLKSELARILNCFSAENGSNTLDYILGAYLQGCLNNFNLAVNSRESWYGRDKNEIASPQVLDLSDMKRRISDVMHSFIFEHNTSSLRKIAKSLVNKAVMESKEFKDLHSCVVICDETNNPANNIANNMLTVDVLAFYDSSLRHQKIRSEIFGTNINKYHITETTISPSMYKQLCVHLDTHHITSENIGSIRRSLFMPFDCEWNSVVRDETAIRENKPKETISW